MKIKEIIGNWFSDNIILSEMANIKPEDSGLNHTIYIGKVGGQHSARIKVSNIPGTFDANDNFSIGLVKKRGEFQKYGTVKIKPRELKKIENWMDINLTDLIAIANHMESNNYDGRFFIYDASGNLTIKTLDQMIDDLKKV